ncbi:MAG: hypothetical protein KAV87_04335 [Desulfobacteraceae bacterium]|nr:hypothetical protein [Desulfobacteraceae bacterium]
MRNEKPGKDLAPYHKPKPLISVDNSAWQTEDADFESLEDLLSLVEVNISKGGYIADVLQRKYLPEGEKKTTSPIETNSGQYTLQYIQDKSTKSYVGIRNLRAGISDATYYITRNRKEYPGSVVRLVSIVQTAMLHYGLHGLDMLLSGRTKVVEDRLEAIRLGSKEKRRRGQTPQYTFVNFIDVLDKQQNITCLSQQDYARATTIAIDYGWPMSFVVQMAMIIAIAGSERLPEDIVKDAREEVRFFTEYIHKNY